MKGPGRGLISLETGLSRLGCLWGGQTLHHRCGGTFLAVLMDELEFGITHTDMKTQERNHYEGTLGIKFLFPRQD